MSYVIMLLYRKIRFSKSLLHSDLRLPFSEGNIMRILVSLSAFCIMQFFNSSPALGQSWDFFEEHAIKGKGTGAGRLLYKNTEAKNIEEFVGICQDMCASGEGDGKNGPCGGFVLNYANKKKNKPKFCVFKKMGSKPYGREGKDTYLMALNDFTGSEEEDVRGSEEEYLEEEERRREIDRMEEEEYLEEEERRREIDRMEEEERAMEEERRREIDRMETEEYLEEKERRREIDRMETEERAMEEERRREIDRMETEERTRDDDREDDRGRDDDLDDDRGRDDDRDRW